MSLIKPTDLTEVPKAVYGTTARSAFCPVRATTLEGIAVNGIWLRWVLFLAHYRNLRLRNRSPAHDPELLHYRSSVYRLMRTKLAAMTPETASDEVFYGLLVAGISEDRIGDKTQASYHLDAGLKLLELRRQSGRQGLRLTTADIIVCGAYIGAGVQDYFKSQHQLLAVQLSFFQQLRSMTEWNRALRQCIDQVDQLLARKDAVTTTSPPSDAYLAIRRSIRDPESVFKRHACVRSEQSANPYTRAQLGALFAINAILWFCRFEEAVAIDFLEDLTRVMTNSVAQTATDQISHLTVMYIISFCGSNLYKKYGSGRNWFDLWRIVDFVEMVMLTSPYTQKITGDMLKSWLLADMTDTENLVMFTEHNESAMADEIEIAWANRQIRQTNIEPWS